jgi:hypothetical protein
MTELTRKMQFERPAIKSSEDLVGVKLVLNLPAEFTQEGEVTLYETSPDDEEHRKILDEGSIPSCHSTCWFELTVGVENLQDSMELLVEFTHRNGEFVHRLNPLMVLFTYQPQPSMDLVPRRRRQAEEDGEEHVNTPLLTLKTQNEACRKHTVRLDYSELQWLGEGVSLISPSDVVFDFCYGHCNTPLDTFPLDDPSESFGKRARILEVMNRLSENRLTPPPCCIPLSYIAKETIYSSGDLVIMTTIPSVQGCGCRA